MKLRDGLLAAAMLATAPAHAATFIITYTGTVSGTDAAGVFGTPGALTGEFTAVYTLTTGIPGVVAGNDGTNAFSNGGMLGTGTPSPVSAALIINGYTTNFFGNYYGEYQLFNGANNPQAVIDYPGEELDYIKTAVSDSADGSTYIINFAYSYDYDFLASSAIAPFSYDLQPGDSGLGNFEIGDSSTRGSFSADRVTVRQLDAVPEPATWAMMLVGFGAIGFSMRRKRHQRFRYSLG